jgi:D-cysteine desulfhydrase
MGLAARFPTLAARLPRLALGEFPTPLDEHGWLAGQSGPAALLVKRDDLSGVTYGGNKVRKLEYLLADARAQGCDAVLTYGSVGSNHALATSLYARQLGLACYAVLLDQPPTPKVAAILRWHLALGTRLVYAASFARSGPAAAAAMAAHPGGAARVYDIPWGGSNWLGSVGFVNAALELADQCTAMHCRPPEFIYLPAGTLGTVLGLCLGLALAGLDDVRMVAARVVPGKSSALDRLAGAAGELNQRLRALDPTIPLVGDPLRMLELRDEFLGAGYADETPAALGAVADAASRCGLKLEGTYSGKAWACLRHDAASGRLSGRRVLFWNTYSSRPYQAQREPAAMALPPALRGYLAS